jgi:hypothetical protein
MKWYRECPNGSTQHPKMTPVKFSKLRSKSEASLEKEGVK